MSLTTSVLPHLCHTNFQPERQCSARKVVGDNFPSKKAVSHWAGQKERTVMWLETFIIDNYIITSLCASTKCHLGGLLQEIQESSTSKTTEMNDFQVDPGHARRPASWDVQQILRWENSSVLRRWRQRQCNCLTWKPTEVSTEELLKKYNNDMCFLIRQPPKLSGYGW